MTTVDITIAAPPQTWADLTRIEPRLCALLADVCAADKGGPTFCRDRAWYGPGHLKTRMLHLVGWLAERPELRTSQAYDAAYRTLYNTLPPCRGCGCDNDEGR